MAHSSGTTLLSPGIAGGLIRGSWCGALPYRTKNPYSVSIRGLAVQPASPTQFVGILLIRVNGWKVQMPCFYRQSLSILFQRWTAIFQSYSFLYGLATMCTEYEHRNQYPFCEHSSPLSFPEGIQEPWQHASILVEKLRKISAIQSKRNCIGPQSAILFVS